MEHRQQRHPCSIPSWALVVAGALALVLVMPGSGARAEPAAALGLRFELPTANEQKELRAIWARAVVWMQLEDGTWARLQATRFQSAKPAAKPATVPHDIVNGVTFSITGWNPMGHQADDAHNRAANARLEADLLGLKPAPERVLPSFGSDEESRWREDGFSAVFLPPDEEAAERDILRLARQYGQAAVCKYKRGPGGDLLREVLPSYPELDALRSSEAVSPLP
eukprot:tig00000605_g2479.t1